MNADLDLLPSNVSWPPPLEEPSEATSLPTRKRQRSNTVPEILSHMVLSDIDDDNDDVDEEGKPLLRSKRLNRAVICVS